MLTQLTSQYQNWSGSQDELVATVSHIEQTVLGQDQKPVNKRTATYYRSKSIIEPAHGKKYIYQHLLQFLLARKLAREGWTVKQLSQIILSLTQEELLHYLQENVSVDELLNRKNIRRASTALAANNYNQPIIAAPITEETLSLPELTIQLLARGIVKQFELTSAEQQIVDGNLLSSELRRSMSLLGRLCLEEGLEDHFASIHETLALCRYPFNHARWPLPVLKQNDFPYTMVNLIDIDHRCPTTDCIELAQGGNEANIREQFTFELLKQTCASSGGRRHEAYTLLREFVCRHPITSAQMIMSFVREHNLDSAERFLTKECYRPIENPHLVNQQLYVCEACSAPLSAIDDNFVQCTIRQCERYHQYTEIQAGINPETDALVLRPHLLAYWFGPAIDELAIYDLAAEKYDACLYPSSDACDIAIDGNDIGIDVKSYASPFLLAQALNQSIGGLVQYQRKIVAISDSVIAHNMQYLELLQLHYRSKMVLEFKSASDVKTWLETAV